MKATWYERSRPALEQIQNALKRGQLENVQFALFPEGFLTGHFFRYEDVARVALSTTLTFQKLLERWPKPEHSSSLCC